MLKFIIHITFRMLGYFRIFTPNYLYFKTEMSPCKIIVTPTTAGFLRGYHNDTLKDDEFRQLPPDCQAIMLKSLEASLMELHPKLTMSGIKTPGFRQLQHADTRHNMILMLLKLQECLHEKTKLEPTPHRFFIQSD